MPQQHKHAQNNMLSIITQKNILKLVNHLVKWRSSHSDISHTVVDVKYWSNIMRAKLKIMNYSYAKSCRGSRRYKLTTSQPFLILLWNRNLLRLIQVSPSQTMRKHEYNYRPHNGHSKNNVHGSSGWSIIATCVVLKPINQVNTKYQISCMTTNHRFLPDLQITDAHTATLVGHE